MIISKKLKKSMSKSMSIIKKKKKLNQEYQIHFKFK